jgi:hypothetical protein
MPGRVRRGTRLLIQALFSSLQFPGVLPINKKQYAMALNPWIKNQKMRLILPARGAKSGGCFFIFIMLHKLMTTGENHE